MPKKRKPVKPERVLDLMLNKANFFQFKKKDCTLPPILDRDPILAANFLTKDDCEKCLELLLDTYTNLGKEVQKNKLLEIEITMSRENFNWFAKFTTEIARLINRIPSLNIPYDYEDTISEGKKVLPVSLLPPVVYKTSKKKVEPVSYKVRDKDPVNTWRIQYIQEQYEERDFNNGFPAWYIMSEITIYEEYSTRTHCRVKIDFLNGEFIYYIAGASDKWRRIIGVPSEIDNVVASLLFKN